MPLIFDLNVDGVPEIIQTIYDFAGSGYGLDLSILEWNGSAFASLIEGELGPDYLSSFAQGEIYGGSAHVSYGSYQFQDLDKNGTTEVVLSSGFFRGQKCFLLYRETKMALIWNGHGFTGFYVRTPATFRIQAVWDGDEASIAGRWDDALISYQRAAYDETLLTWSLGFKDEWSLCPSPSNFTPVPTNPALDTNEKPRLAAYSLYRMVLIQALRGDRAKAGATFDTLQEQYQTNAGSSYWELAKVFWDEYSTSQSINKACQRSTSYAEAHQNEILVPLDRETYGGLSPIYTYLPESICPFK